MKKALILISLFAILLSACAANNVPISLNTETVKGSGSITTEERSVSNFVMVVMKTYGNVVVTHGDTESLTISADENLLPYITTDVIDGRLEISTKPNINLDPSQTILYTVTVKSLSTVVLSGFGDMDIDSLEGNDLAAQLTGSGNINIGQVNGESLGLDLTGFGNVNISKVETNSAALNLSGSGDISLPSLTANDLTVTLSGFGDVTVSGAAQMQEINLTGSGNYVAGDFETETSYVTISGFGDATTWANEGINVTISGSGNVEYYGSPTISSTLTGFGSVKSLGEHQ